MIHYNMRYRGPYEYDKFILNIFQCSNAIYDFKNDLSENSYTNSINGMRQMVDSMYNEAIKYKGSSDRVYRDFIMLS